MEVHLPRIASFAGNWASMARVNRAMAHRRLTKACVAQYLAQQLGLDSLRDPSLMVYVTLHDYLNEICTCLTTIQDGRPPRRKLVYTRYAPHAPMGVLLHHIHKCRPFRPVASWTDATHHIERGHHIFRITPLDIRILRTYHFTVLALIY